MASGGNRPLHRCRVQLALREFAFAEADSLLEAVQDCVGVLRFESDNEEPHGICAEGLDRGFEAITKSRAGLGAVRVPGGSFKALWENRGGI